MSRIKQPCAAAIFRAAICIWLVCALLLPLVPASQAKEVRKVRVGYLQVENFQEGGPGEIKSGYGYEYLQMVRSYTGWEYEYVYGDWETLLKKLERGQIDLLSHVPMTNKRKELFLFSNEPQNQEPQYLFTMLENEEISADAPETLQGTTIGILAADYRRVMLEAWCTEHEIECNIVEYNEVQQMHQDLAEGILDAITDNSLAFDRHANDWKSIVRLGNEPVYFAVSRFRPDLLRQLNDAQRQILNLDEFYGEELRREYQSGDDNLIPELTEAQLAYVQSCDVLRVGYCERRPLAFTDRDSGKLSGLLADYLEAIQIAYGLRFEGVPCTDGYDLMNSLLEGKVDIISPVGYNYGIAEKYGVRVTVPITVEAMLAVYKGYSGTLPKNIFGRIAVLSNSITERDYVRRCYPDALMVEADSVEDALNMVKDGHADSYLMRATYWSWGKNDYPQLNELQVLNLPNANDVNMALRKEDAELLPILNKGISLLSESQRIQSVVTYSDARKEVTLSYLFQENPLTFGLAFLALVLVLISAVAVYRLLVETAYMKKLRTAKDQADQARIYAEASRAEAERANLAKSTFMTSMSHDIRTPMNAVIGMTTLANKHLDDPEYIRNCLHKVALASNHLLTLINDVLDLNKIETGKLNLNYTVFSLSDSIMNLANISRPLIRDKKHTFEIRVHNVNQEHVFADELRINQIFINLLSNAIKYTPPGGRILVDIKEEPIPDDPEKLRLIYVVEDNGIGMDAEFQDHMYELFAMANKHNPNSNGSGVGLAICKQLIDLMGGSIQCESEKGVGTKFTVSLELAAAEQTFEHEMLPPMKLLLVDDDDVFLETAANTLQAIGLSPDVAHSGREAVAIVREKHQQNRDYPVIIIDWQMPGMSGLETIKAIRQLVGPDVSIIVVSAYDPEDVKQAAMDAGANAFLCKPFFRSAIYQDMTRILGLEQKSDPVEQPHNHCQGMHLLVAEDNDLNWEIARELLKMYGITTVRAENGQICLDMLEAAPPGAYDLVLMDIQMPVMNGYEAAQAIRASDRKDIRMIPIIAMTADAFTEDVIRCKAYGMNSHVAKPVDIEHLMDEIVNIRSSPVVDIYD